MAEWDLDRMEKKQADDLRRRGRKARNGAEADRDAPVFFTEGRLIDGNGGPPVENAVLAVSGKRIFYAGPAETAPVPPPGAVVLRLRGRTLMPGIIDTHLHYSGNLSDNDSQWVTEPLLQKSAVAVAQAREALENGLTSAGEISRFGPAIRDMIEAGILEGPRTVTAGAGFCRTAGHGDSHRMPLWYNEESHPWAERVDGPWELRRAIRRRIRENPDAIKIWATGGGIWRHDKKADSHYTPEEIRAVTEECAMVGLPVWAHAEGYQGALDACEAGVAVIIHGQELNDACLDIMKEKDITFCPTLQFFYEWFSVYEPPYRPVHDQYPGDTTAEKELNRIIDNLRKAREKGIRITVGSDSFCSSLTPYGIYAVTEMYALNKACLSPMETIRAATRNGAEMLGIQDLTGTLEAGKYADLLVIDGRPDRDIRDIRSETMAVIMKEGRFIKI